MESNKTDELTIKVYDLLRTHEKLSDSELNRDITVWGYSNPISTKFKDIEEAVSFFSRFEELSGLNLTEGQFKVFANATVFTIEKQVIINK